MKLLQISFRLYVFYTFAGHEKKTAHNKYFFNDDGIVLNAVSIVS
jgi:hypothetical protein